MAIGTGDLGMIAQVAQVAGEFGNQGGKALQRRRDKKYEQQLWERNRKAALDDWQIQTEYDKPINQMARLSEAGLNPNLIYGDATAATGSSPGISQQSNPAPQREGFSISPDIGNRLMQIEMMRIQSQNMEASQDLTRAQILKTLTDVDSTKLKTALLQHTFDDLVKAAALGNAESEVNIDFKKQQTDESKQRIEESKTRIQKMGVDMQFTLDENQRQQVRSILENKKTEQDTKLIIQKILTEKKATLEAQSRIEKNEVEQKRIAAQVRMLDAQIKFMTSKEAREWAKTILPW